MNVWLKMDFESAAFGWKLNRGSQRVPKCRVNVCAKQVWFMPRIGLKPRALPVFKAQQNLSLILNVKIS
ncbi:MAG: hypothetical protein DWI00_12540 [Planctomycetota bacterium]|nr:MAG: hypothetical protein DWI00_12540 [Planctomycetota bacterium]